MLFRSAQSNEQLQTHIRHGHAAAAGGGGHQDNRKPEKFPRPELKLDSSVEDWAEFQTCWDQYKQEYSLAGAQLIRQLYAACSDELKQSLSRITGGSQFTKSETELLKIMKELSVQYQNPAVHVQTFLSITQQQDEGVRHYLTRLRGVATRCEFSEKCPDCQTQVSYSDSVVRFKLIAGLYDQEIKEDILSKADMKLEETVKAIEAKESGKIARRTVGVLGAPVAGKAATVSGQPGVKCGHCGKIGRAHV